MLININVANTTDTTVTLEFKARAETKRQAIEEKVIRSTTATAKDNPKGQYGGSIMMLRDRG